MEEEFEDLAPELRKALDSMLAKASSDDGRRMAYKVIRRENEIWPLVRQVLEEAREGSGSPPSLNSLWEEIQKEVRNTILAVLYRKDKENVDEVEQRTFLEVLRKLNDFSIEKATFLVWVKGIARCQARWLKTPVTAGAEVEPAPVPANQVRSLPPSECYRELLSWVQEKEAHHVVVFLLHEYLRWTLESIARDLGERTIPDLATLTVRQIQEDVKGLKNTAELFARLHKKAADFGERKLQDLYGAESATAALGHWSGGVKRWMCAQVIGSAKKLLTGVCELSAGTHERLTFLWSRFLRRGLGLLVLCADQSLLKILKVFRKEFPPTDLTPEEVTKCTEPLMKDILPHKTQVSKKAVAVGSGLPADTEPQGMRTLAECGRGDLAEDLLVWRQRVQVMVVAKCKARNVVAYAYLCGALPGIVGPAKGGVA